MSFALLRRSLSIPGVAILASGACTLPGLAVASDSNRGRETKGTSNGDEGLDAARKRLLESPPTAAGDLEWRKVVQQLLTDEEWWLKHCLNQEKRGEVVELAETYKTWKQCREELDMYERDPRRWLRRHGRYCGLAAPLTLTEHVGGS